MWDSRNGAGTFAKVIPEMASMAANTRGADWKAAFRRSLARALQIACAVALFAFTAFLALALMSYQPDRCLAFHRSRRGQRQLDGRARRSGRPIWRWPGSAGSRCCSCRWPMFLPASCGAGWKRRNSWGRRWWRTVLLLLLAMALLATVLSLVSDPREWSMPASTGGLVRPAGRTGGGGAGRAAARNVAGSG